MKKRLKNKIINFVINYYAKVIAKHNSKICNMRRYQCKVDTKYLKQQYIKFSKVKVGDNIKIEHPIFNDGIIINLKKYHFGGILYSVKIWCEGYENVIITYSINPNHCNCSIS